MNITLPDLSPGYTQEFPGSIPVAMGFGSPAPVNHVSIPTDSATGRVLARLHALADPAWGECAQRFINIMGSSPFLSRTLAEHEATKGDDAMHKLYMCLAPYPTGVHPFDHRHSHRQKSYAEFADAILALPNLTATDLYLCLFFTFGFSSAQPIACMVLHAIDYAKSDAALRAYSLHSA